MQRACPAADTVLLSPAKPDPKTVLERAQQIYEATNPYEATRQQVGLHGLSTVEKTAYLNSDFVDSGTVDQLGKKAQKELWKQVNEASTPSRKLPPPLGESWAKDKYGRNVAEYAIEQYEDRGAKVFRLTVLLGQSRRFKEKRGQYLQAIEGSSSVEASAPLEEPDIEAERTRRMEMAALKDELYGEKMGSYATDPAWDDVVPIPQTEPEGALASIAYPEDYAECKLKWQPSSLL